MTVSGSMLLSGIKNWPDRDLVNCSNAYFLSEVTDGICTNPGVFRTVLSLVAKSFITCCFVGIYSF